MSKELTGYKGYNTIVKGIVVNTEDPENLNRVQVRIPSYHGDKEFQSEDGTSGLPWAQICSVTTKSSGIIGLLGGGQASTVIPEVDDIVWLMFEGGDIRYPVVVGTIPKDTSGDSSDGSDFYVSGGSLTDIATEIIMAQEGSYDSINPNDNGAISIGAIQWHAGRALSLLEDIRKKNKSEFDKIVNDNNSGLISDMNKSWSNYITQEGTPTYNALKSILGTDFSKETQDELLKKDVTEYIEHGRSLGITEPDALIYFADYENQNGSSGASSMLKKCNKPYTLDNIHAVAKSNYTERRNRVYAACKKAKEEGKLNLVNGDLTNSSITIQSGAQLAFPTSWRHLSAGYPRYPSGRAHSGIDFDCPTGTTVVAVTNGTISKVKRLNYSYGHYVTIKSGNLEIFTCHMSYIPNTITVGKTVKQGDVLGQSGNTGNSTGPHLHFEVRRNGTAVDPGPYLGVNVSKAGNV